MGKALTLTQDNEMSELCPGTLTAILWGGSFRHSMYITSLFSQPVGLDPKLERRGDKLSLFDKRALTKKYYRISNILCSFWGILITKWQHRWKRRCFLFQGETMRAAK